MHYSLRAAGIAALALAFMPAMSQAQYSIQSYWLSAVADNPTSVDFNRDGVPDFLGILDTDQNLISGNGTYTYKNVGVSIPPNAAGDFNNDGKLDYVVGSGNYLYLYYGNGDGTFTPGPVATGEGGARYLVADFNSDGRPDVAALSILDSASTTGGGFDINLFLNNGNGFDPAKLVFHVTFPANYEDGWPYNTPGITIVMPFLDFALGDFDGDSHADLMLRTLCSSMDTPVPVTFIRVLYGDGHGNFTAKTVASGNNRDQVSVADMNNDGSTDIVAINGDASTIYYGHPNRTFTNASVSTPGGVFLEPMLVDVSGDGLKDLVYISTCTDTETCPDAPSGVTPTGITTLLQTPSHTFTSAGFVQVQDVYMGSFIGDYNHDGKLDVALYNGPQEGSNYESTSKLYLVKNARSISALCPAPTDSSFHICSPTGASAASPVQFNLSASSFYPIRKMEVWVDGKKLSETYNSVGEQAFANPSLSLSAGKHTVSFFSGAYDGSVQKTTYTLNVQ